MRAFIPPVFRIRMALLFGLLAGLVGLPTYLYVSGIHREQLIADRQDKLQTIVVAAAAVLGENLVERRREIELLSQSVAFSEGAIDSPEIVASLERLKLSYRHYSWIGFASREGRVLAATSGHLLGADVSQRPWFKEGGRGAYVGDLHEAVLLAKLLPESGTGQPLRFIDVAAPVYSDDGELRGVLAAHAYWQWAGTVLSAALPPSLSDEGVQVFIVDRRNKIIFPEGVEAEASRALDAVQHGAARATSFREWGNGVEYLTATQRIVEPTPEHPLEWRLIARQPATVVVSGVTALQRVVLAASLLAGLAFLILAWLAADRMSRPLERLTAIAQRIQRGEEEIVFEAPTGSQELRRLSHALGDMARSLVERRKALEASNRDLEQKVLARTEALSRANEELSRLARTDILTGLPNRMHANERLADEFARLRRTLQPYVVLAADIDFFKRVNDQFGHASGDRVLRGVGRLLRESLRETDFIARTGGEEFLAILPHTDARQARHVAEKLRRAVEQTPIDPVGRISISVGLAQASPDHGDADQAVRDADRALYLAKESGRNRVMGGPA